MELRRYRKAAARGEPQAEACSDGEFVAFWSDTKYIFARDRAGEEWMLESGMSLDKVAAGVEGLVRISRNCLVRTNAIEAVRNLDIHSGTPRLGVFIIAGFEYQSSRRRRRGWPVGEYQQGQLAA